MNKSIITLALSFTLLLAPAMNGQNQSGTQLAGPQTYPSFHSDRLEDDPGFRRLTLAGQERVRKMTQRLHAAIEQHDVRAIDQLRRDLIHYQLTGATFCGGHVVDESTHLDEFAPSEIGNAFLVRWVDPERASSFVHTAVFTGNRCVALDGDMIEGKKIAKILPNALAVSQKNGFVAYEALYADQASNAGGPQPYRLGVFIENRFLTDIDPKKVAPIDAVDASRDFRWRKDQELLDVKPEIILHVAPVQPVASQAPASRIGLIVAPAFQQAARSPRVANPSRPATPPAQAMDAKAKPLTPAVKPKPPVPAPPKLLWPTGKPKTGATN